MVHSLQNMGKSGRDGARVSSDESRGLQELRAMLELSANTSTTANDPGEAAQRHRAVARIHYVRRTGYITSRVNGPVPVLVIDKQGCRVLSAADCAVVHVHVLYALIQ